MLQQEELSDHFFLRSSVPQSSPLPFSFSFISAQLSQKTLRRSPSREMGLWSGSARGTSHTELVFTSSSQLGGFSTSKQSLQDFSSTCGKEIAIGCEPALACDHLWKRRGPGALSAGPPAPTLSRSSEPNHPQLPALPSTSLFHLLVARRLQTLHHIPPAPTPCGHPRATGICPGATSPRGRPVARQQVSPAPAVPFPEPAGATRRRARPAPAAVMFFPF